MTHSTALIDLNSSGPEGLERALRNLPVGGTIKLMGSGLGLKRVHGGRAFQLSTPPKVTEPLHVPVAALKSIKTAVPAIVEAHEEVLQREELAAGKAYPPVESS